MSGFKQEMIFTLNVVMLGVVAALLYLVFWLYLASILLGWLWLAVAHQYGFKSLVSLALLIPQIIVVNMLQPDSYLFTAFVFIPVLIYFLAYKIDKTLVCFATLVSVLAGVAMSPGVVMVLLVKYERVMQGFVWLVEGGSI